MPTLLEVQAPRHQRRKPEETVLYRAVAEHLATFLARIDTDPDRRGLPGHVRREFDRYLSCGILAAGFCRVYCESCRTSTVVAFSCKARAVCPSCTGRRMAEVGAHLVDHVLPDVPIRQWVLSLPHKVRFLLARDPKLCRKVRGVFIRAVQSFYVRRARDEGVPLGRCGAVVYVQRFDSALRLDVHFHALVLDGVYTGFGVGEPLVFHEARRLRDEEIESLVQHIEALLRGHLLRRGVLDEAGQLDPSAGEDLDPLGTCHAASIQGLIPFGEKRGQRVTLWGEADERSRPPPGLKKRLCADHHGYSLHAGVRVAANSARREHLARYVARGPLATDRLSLNQRGDIVYRFRRRWRTGKQAVVMDPLTFLSRLAALIPPPRSHVLSYYGVLGAAAARRDEIVPEPPSPESERVPHGCSASRARRARSKRKRQRRPRIPWATLLERVFLLDVLRCDCGGRRRVLAMIRDPSSIERVLTHLGLPTGFPPRGPPRAVPRSFPFAYSHSR